jgi:hypothetical protein
VLAAALGSLLPTIEHGRQHFLKPLGLKRPGLLVPERSWLNLPSG